MKYVKENMNVTIKFFKGSPFSVEPPNFVELVVAGLNRASEVIR